MGGKQLSRARIADELKTAMLEIAIRELDGTNVRIRLARDLAQNPIAPPGSGGHNRWAPFGLGQVGKRERNENYRPC
jgi:hypothetical protein